MIMLTFFNWITFGLVHWFFANLFIPVANWLTFGALAPQLLATNWVLGAAIVSAAGDFRDAHKYLGLLGYINSWFMGMLLFWLMFRYGIFTAMVAHAIYDMILFVARALKSREVGILDYRFRR